MSALSSIVNALTNGSLVGSKNDTKASDASFLSLLSIGAGNGSVTDDQQNAALVDALYSEKDDDTLPVAVAVPPQIQVNHDHALPEAAGRKSETVQSSPKEEYPAAREDAPVASQKSEQNTPEKNTEQAVQTSSSKPATQNKDAEPDAADTDVSNVDALADKIRAKIGELSDLLSVIASLLGVNPSSIQITQVQVTQTTLSTSITQSTLGVNQPFVDLSDRFQQLIAAMNAGQNLPSEMATPLTMTFRSFQAMFASMSMNNTDSTLPDFGGQFMASCKSCETQLTLTTQSLASVGGAPLNTSLGEHLKKLQQWIGEFQALAKEAVAPAKAELSSNASALNASVMTAPTATNDNTPTLTTAPVASAPTTSAPVSAQPMTQDTVQNALTPIAVAAVQNNANPDANFSGGNGNTGQNQSQQQTAPLTAATSATSNTATTQASSFAKTLRAATTHTPVVEQVAFNIKSAVKDGSSKIEIKLDPESLGKVSIKLDVDAHGKTVVSVTADHKSTLDLLQRDARGLEQALADAGLKSDSGSLSFNLRGGNQQQQQEDKRGAYGNYAPAVEEEELAPLAVVSKNYVVNMTDGLDIQI